MLYMWVVILQVAGLRFKSHLRQNLVINLCYDKLSSVDRLDLGICNLGYNQSGSTRHWEPGASMRSVMLHVTCT